MPAAPSIRPAGLLDVGAVLELWSLARTPYSQTPDTLAGLERLIEHSPGALLVAELDGRVVGTLIAAWDGWRGTMYRLAVHPGSRRRGIARRLVGVGEERLRARRSSPGRTSGRGTSGRRPGISTTRRPAASSRTLRASDRIRAPRAP